VVEEDVGNTSALDVTPPEADTLKVPFAYVVKKANGVEDYWAVKVRTDATQVVLAAIRTGVGSDHSPSKTHRVKLTRLGRPANAKRHLLPTSGTS